MLDLAKDLVQLAVLAANISGTAEPDAVLAADRAANLQNLGIQRIRDVAHPADMMGIGEVEERQAKPSVQTAPSTGEERGPRVAGGGGPDVAPLGRNKQLRLLEERLNAALAGARQLVFLTGEAGLGKTTLVEAFLLC